MKDWHNLIADEEHILDRHFTPGRGGRDVEYVYLHHNSSNLSLRGIYDVWLVRQASCHYQVDQNGRVGQYVNDWDTAWQVGDWEANLRGIGIEHANMTLRPTWLIWPETLNQGSKLCAAICRNKDLGMPVWEKNVFGHSHYFGTECPGALAGSQNALYFERARYWYDNLDSELAPNVTPTPQSPPAVPTKPNIPENFPLPYPLPYGHYFGNIDGDERSHGGYYVSERPWIKSIQEALAILGFTPNGPADLTNGWCDGLFEQPTIDAAAAFQRKFRPNGTEFWGQIWDDDLETMRAQFA